MLRALRGLEAQPKATTEEVSRFQMLNAGQMVVILDTVTGTVTTVKPVPDVEGKR